MAGWTSEGPSNLHSLIAGVNRDGKLVHVGRIGAGYSAAKALAKGLCDAIAADEPQRHLTVMGFSSVASQGRRR